MGLYYYIYIRGQLSYALSWHTVHVLMQGTCLDNEEIAQFFDEIRRLEFLSICF